MGLLLEIGTAENHSNVDFVANEIVIAGAGGHIQKSLGHFSFARLTRQTTNLEQIR